MKLGSQVTPIPVSSRARLSCISHLLSMISYQDRPPIELPPRRTDISYVRPPMGEQTYVPEEYKRPASFDAVSRSQLVVGSGVAWSGQRGLKPPAEHRDGGPRPKGSCGPVLPGNLGGRCSRSAEVHL